MVLLGSSYVGADDPGIAELNSPILCCCELTDCPIVNGGTVTFRRPLVFAKSILPVHCVLTIELGIESTICEVPFTDGLKEVVSSLWYGATGMDDNW